VFLAQTVKRVHLLVRSSSLSASMSRYLIRRIEETPTIQLKTRTEIVALEETNSLSVSVARRHRRGNQSRS